MPCCTRSPLGLGVGATATVARRIGEGDAHGAAHAAVQAVVLGLAAAVLFGVGGVLAAPHLLKVMGADAGVLAVGTTYAA